MKTNNTDIFDELMRQKLGDYSEEPEMELMGNIHAKKNRLIRLYGLYKMFAIVCIVGLGLLSSYFLLRPTEQLSSGNSGTNTEQSIAVQSEVSTSGSNAYIQHNKSTYSQPVSASASDLHTSTTVNQSNSSASSSVHSSSSINPTNHQQNITISSTPSGKNSTSPSITHPASDKKEQHITGKKIVSESSTIDANKQTKVPSSLDKNTDSKEDKDAVKEDKSEKEVKDSKDKDSKSSEEKNKDKQAKAECKSAFDYYVSYDGKYIFTNFSEHDPNARLVWDFGDGAQSSLTSPTHAYTQPGNYIVTLQVIDSKNSCSDASHKNIAFNINNNKKGGVSIKGRVLGNSEPVGGGRVKLLQFDREANAFVLLTKSPTSMSGEYSFSNVKAGRYLVLAEGNNNSFIPTYWGNVVKEEEALDITIMENDADDLLGYNISLFINKNENASDPSHVSNADSLIGGGSTLLVFDQNNKMITSVQTDPNGRANLSGLPPGDYNILDPETGASSKVHYDGSAANNNSTTKTEPNKSITIVPNPAVDNFKFELQASKTSTAEVTIVNGSGSTVYHGTYPCTDGMNLLDISIYNLPPGEYYVVVNINGAQTMSGRLIKNATSNDR